MANFTTDGKICMERALDVPQNKIELDDIIQRYNIQGICKWIKENTFSKCANNTCALVGSYSLNLIKVKKNVTSFNMGNVCLQFPDDLIGISTDIYEEIRKETNIDLYILGDTSYASCCIDSVAAMHVQGEAVVHFGHSCFTKSNIPVFTVLPKKHLHFENVKTILKKHFKFSDSKLCLFYDAEYEHCRDEILKFWFQNFPQCFVGIVQMDETPNRFLGRLVKNAEGEEIAMKTLTDYTCIYIGSRGQTVFNFSISVPALKWFLLDPEDKKLECLEETTWFKRRRFLIEKCKDANVIGILVCKLAGDQTKDIITQMKQLCKVNGKKSYIVSVGKPNVAKLANFPEIEIYVMIACPENDLYNSRDFYRPIVYPFELEVALNSNRQPYYNYHVTDYDDLLPGKRHYLEIDHIKEATDVSLITGNIRETRIQSKTEGGKELAEKQNWALESIGHNLQQRSWKGLEQKLGESDVKIAEKGRQGIPLQYSNEPE